MGQAQLADADHARLAAAREKRLRKLSRYTGTPEALRRRAAMEVEHSQGVPLDEEYFPRRSPEPDSPTL